MKPHPCPACGKTSYTHADARAAARRINSKERRDWPVEAYPCNVGGSGWHYGHVRRKGPDVKRRKRR